jgi:RHS repeat-associated protein
LTDNTGNITARYEYDAFGQIVGADGSADTNSLYTGQEFDPESELVYMNARYYNPTLGRFISRDGVLGRVGAVVSRNGYVYVLNNPLKYTDPSGMEENNQFWFVNFLLSPGFQGGLHATENIVMPLANIATFGSFARIDQNVTDINANGASIQNSTSLFVNIVGGTVISSAVAFDIGVSLGFLALSTQEYFAIRSQNISLNPNTIQQTQSSVNNAQEIIQDMKTNGWNGPPIDVVRMQDGTLKTLDNTRLMAAKYANINVSAVVHDSTEIIPADLASRFSDRSGGLPVTWGDAVVYRINTQNNIYRATYPNGSDITGWNGN